MNFLSKNKGAIVIFLVGVLVGFWVSNLTDSNLEVIEEDVAVEESNIKDTSVNTVITGENNLVVSTQPAGSSVTMSMVLVNQSGWVAIHENIDGTLGRILGARRFDEGQYFGESIELLRNTEAERTYSAVLHGDDGDSEFDFKTEIPVKDIIGSMVAEDFFVTDSSI